MLRNLLAAAGFFLCTFASAHTSYSDSLTCPIDGERFEIWVTGSYTTFGTFKDFQKYGAIGDLYESMINGCPKCHYCGFRKDFDTTFSAASKKEILDILAPYKDMKLNDVLENEIAAQLHIHFKTDNDRIANIYLIASYLLRKDSVQVEKRKELQRKAIDHLLKGLEAKEYTASQTATIHYLAGDLYRRTGDFENAVKYFDLAISNAEKKEWVLPLAEEQKKLALEKNDRNDI